MTTNKRKLIDAVTLTTETAPDTNTSNKKKKATSATDTKLVPKNTPTNTNTDKPENVQVNSQQAPLKKKNKKKKKKSPNNEEQAVKKDIQVTSNNSSKASTVATSTNKNTPSTSKKDNTSVAKPKPPTTKDSNAPSSNSKSTKIDNKQSSSSALVLPLFPDGVPDLTKHKELQKTMDDKLKSSQFRYINEQLYTMTGQAAKELFDENPELPQVYHTGYRRQVSQWPVNPLTLIIERVKELDATWPVADFGCGDAMLAASVPNPVHSFDLFAANERVTVCEMSHVPLKKDSVRVAVFCLSLMGTNFKDYITEANRVLVTGGILLIAEVRSRIDSMHDFVEFLKEAGFVYDKSNKRHKMFVWFEFHKSNRGFYSSKERAVALLKPCKYKKR